MFKHPATSAPTLRDLDTVTRNMTAAYILATLVLCGALIFSYFTLKNILTEQSRLSAFGATANELSTTLSVSNLYLTDLKAAKALPPSESRLVPKISAQMHDVLSQIALLKKTISEQLISLQAYKYYDDFDSVFYKPPHNISNKIDQYTNRLKEISAESTDNIPGNDLLWLPVEATAARNGALGKSYASAMQKLQVIIAGRSNHLASTHKALTLFSLCIAVLELLLIFLPLRHRLKKVNSNLVSAHEDLFIQANYDKQSGLSNKAGAAKTVQSELAHQRYSCLLLISLDNTDNISKIVGPTALDFFFQEFVKKLRLIDTTENLIFRAGDNEFAILQSNLITETNVSAVHSIKNELSQQLYIENKIVYPKIRLGYTDGPITSDNLAVKLIDARLAAQQYRHTENHIPRYDSSMRSDIEDENLLVEKIRIGLTNKEFIPFYQLKVDAKSGLICGMEALCRWKQSDGSLLPPFKFIPIAEKSGLITEITWQMLDQIVADYNAWVSHGLNPGRVAFNADEIFLREVNFASRITKIVNNTTATNCPIDLEITENVALGREDEVIAKACSVARELGMGIALDDFGTGYASLSSIVGLDVDIIKVDQSFVRMMSKCNDSKNIVLTIIYLCKQLNKKCVVEGVETQEEYDFCRSLGCDEIQGYYFFKPAPFADVLESLALEQMKKKAG